jgi:hypothetical protein
MLRSTLGTKLHMIEVRPDIDKMEDREKDYKKL